MIKRFLKEYFIITFGAVLASASVYFFMLPSKLAVGSSSAVAMILSNFIPLPVSTITLILNVILLILGFLLVGPEFGAKTIYASIILPISMGVFEFFFPNFQSLTGDPAIDLVCHIIVVGAAMAILFSHNASSGGIDIVAKIMNKYLKMELGSAVSVSGMIVAVSSIICYDTKTVVLSVLGTYFGGMLVDRFIFGINIKRKVCVISPKFDEIVKFILHKLGSGATLYESIGAYDNSKKMEVVTIVDKNEYRLLMDFIKKADPKAFVTVYSVNDMRYQPKIKAPKNVTASNNNPVKKEN